MSPDRKLLFLLVHGIGPQCKELHVKFLESVKEAVRKHLGPDKAGLMDRLEMLRADWSGIFKNQEDGWLKALFPKYDDRKDKAKRTRKFGWIAASILLVAAIGPSIAIYVFEALHRKGMWFPHSTTGQAVCYLLVWLAGALLTAVVLGLAWKYFLGRRLPWGDVWSLGRDFEAHSASDIILYQSEKPRQKIQEVVLTALDPFLAPQEGSNRPGCEEGQIIPIFLAGHSLGTVVIYDMLLGARTESWVCMSKIGGNVSAVKREIASLQAQSETRDELPPSDAIGKRLDFLRRVDNANVQLTVVGMATFGSPISLFMFRKPELASRRNLWALAHQPEFVKGVWGKVKWSWKNFWHASDFVAHRLEPLFNEGYDGPGGKFVEDVRIWRRVKGPITAHSCYWEEERVIDQIGRQVAECLKAL